MLRALEHEHTQEFLQILTIAAMFLDSPASLDEQGRMRLDTVAYAPFIRSRVYLYFQLLRNRKELISRITDYHARNPVLGEELISALPKIEADLVVIASRQAVRGGDQSTQESMEDEDEDLLSSPQAEQDPQNNPQEKEAENASPPQAPIACEYLLHHLQRDYQLHTTSQHGQPSAIRIARESVLEWFNRNLMPLLS